jgi:hypothetical protein
MEEFIAVPIPTEVDISCNLCDRTIDDDEVYYIRIRDAAYVCRSCRESNPEKDAL